MEDEPFLRALGELPYLPFHQTESSRCREPFVGLGLPGADDSDFESAWRNLSRVYRRGAAGSAELASLIELASLHRREDRQERLIALIERLGALSGTQSYSPARASGADVSSGLGTSG